VPSRFPTLADMWLAEELRALKEHIVELERQNEFLRGRVRELEAQVRGYEWGLSNANAEALAIENDADLDD